MFRTRMTRAIVVGLLVGTAIPGALSPAPSAAAAGASIKCTGAAATGGIQAPISLTGCSGNTGGSGVLSTLPPNHSILWANSKTTTLTTLQVNGETDFTETLSCPAGDRIENEFAGTVTADTTGSAAVGGVAEFELCQDPAFNSSLEPGTVATFGSGPKIKCTGAGGGTVQTSLTGCSGNTGGSGLIDGLLIQPPPNTFSGPIFWANGTATTVTVQTTDAETDPTETLSCPAGTVVEVEAKGTVKADTSGSAAVGGVAKFELCFNGAGGISLEPPAARFK